MEVAKLFARQVIGIMGWIERRCCPILRLTCAPASGMPAITKMRFTNFKIWRYRLPEKASAKYPTNGRRQVKPAPLLACAKQPVRPPSPSCPPKFAHCLPLNAVPAEARNSPFGSQTTLLTPPSCSSRTSVWDVLLLRTTLMPASKLQAALQADERHFAGDMRIVYDERWGRLLSLHASPSQFFLGAVHLFIFCVLNVLIVESACSNADTAVNNRKKCTESIKKLAYAQSVACPPEARSTSSACDFRSLIFRIFPTIFLAGGASFHETKISRTTTETA